ncbi:PAS domain S-box protein [Undibacterium sp. LX40W]|uniref:histidine kinase n=1 Tax=Undibacterium nitidum TaxID=2762298 RepID=A0A923HK47_9BURK|nr:MULTISPECIES: PAS domain S-box protein [Undibacterium]MBC3881125.1 PAS domain S-box protein [Undibacterium nitidum]MBC3890142.1 PAS domain S-box protein [Undibacterium sp. LX40W]
MQVLSFNELESLVSTLIDQIPVGIVILDRDYRLRFINDRHAKNNQLRKDEQLGKRLCEFLPHAAPIIEPKLQFVLDHGIPLLDQEIISKQTLIDGSTLHRIASYYPWQNKDKETIGIIGIIQDSKVDQFAQRMLEESQFRLLKVLDNLFTFVGVLELDGTLTNANRAPLDAAGLSLESVAGKKVWDTYWFEHDPQVQQQLQEDIKACLNGVIIRRDIQAQMLNGELMWLDFMLAPLRDADGRITHLIPSANDISKRHKSEEALQKSEELFHSIILASDDAIITKTLDGVITAWNPAATRLLGYSEEEALGQAITVLFPPERIHEEQVLLARIGRGEKVLPFETVRIHKDGSAIDVSVTISPLRDRSGKVVGACKLARDISVQNAQRRQISQALQDKTALLHEVHHRVKNNLQIVSSLLNMQARRASPEVATAFSECQTRIRAMALVHQLLYESENMAEVDLSLYLSQLSGLSRDSYKAENSNIDIVFEMPDQRILIDLQRAIPCGLIVSELVLNAYKHAFQKNDDGKILVRLTRLGASAFQLIVSDNGCGLPLDFSWESRAGLGTQLIPMFAKQLRAKFRHTSSSKGSSFYFDIPIVAEET